MSFDGSSDIFPDEQDIQVAADLGLQHADAKFPGRLAIAGALVLLAGVGALGSSAAGVHDGIATAQNNQAAEMDDIVHKMREDTGCSPYTRGYVEDNRAGLVTDALPIVAASPLYSMAEQYGENTAAAGVVARNQAQYDRMFDKAGDDPECADTLSGIPH